MKGAYILIIKLDRKKRIKVGKLGTFTFPEGYYIYVGSALNNLEKRVLRHLKREKKLKWHIDYFLKHAEVKLALLFPSNEREECKIARKIEKYGKVIAKKFGSSDCKCITHLFYFKNFKELEKALINLH